LQKVLWYVAGLVRLYGRKLTISHFDFKLDKKATVMMALYNPDQEAGAMFRADGHGGFDGTVDYNRMQTRHRISPEFPTRAFRSHE
jgi:hypothetical protein